ncbi:hypothetical protein ACP70R_044495 [Stipagrostis hirtigluma subsp. patula]
MAPAGRRKEKGNKKSTIRKKGSKKTSKRQSVREVISWTLSGFRRYMAYWRSPDQDICYICGVKDHVEHFCPFNYIYGRYDSETCRGECSRGQHRITSLRHRKFLRHFVRVSNLPQGFEEWDLKELFTPFGPLMVWDVPIFTSEFCGCTGTFRDARSYMSFGVVIFKKREDGERAINELNGYETRGGKLRVDWAYPSCV